MKQLVSVIVAKLVSSAMGMDRLKRKSDEALNRQQISKQLKIDVGEWTASQVQQWLVSQEFHQEIVDRFVGKYISVHTFNNIT